MPDHEQIHRPALRRRAERHDAHTRTGGGDAPGPLDLFVVGGVVGALALFKAGLKLDRTERRDGNPGRLEIESTLLLEGQISSVRLVAGRVRIALTTATAGPDWVYPTDETPEAAQRAEAENRARMAEWWRQLDLQPEVWV
jgi:hypothetical protein